MSKSNTNMLSGPIAKGLLTMTMPILIMNVMQSIFGIVDMRVLKMFSSGPSDTAVGAVGVCTALIVLITGFVIGTSVGVNVVVAKNVGAGDKERAERAVGTSMLFALVSGFALLLIGVVFARIFLTWNKCDVTILPQATTYFRLYFVGAPILLILNFSAAILRSVGETRRTMYFILTGGIVKLVLNFIFIKYLNLGVVGVALATIISNAVAGGLCLSVLMRNKCAVTFVWRHFKFYREELGEMLKVGIPAGLQQGLYSLANVVISTAVNGFGPDATTGLSIANSFDGILYQVALATPYAATPYIAQNIGAGNVKRAKKALLSAMFITTAFGATLGSLSAIFSPELSSIMSSTPAVIEFSCQKMIIISSTYFICGMNEVMAGALRGIGKPMVPTVTTLVFMCALRFVWVWFIFPLCPNLTFLYLVWPVGWTLSIIVHLIVYFPTMSKLQKNAVEVK